MRPSRAARRPGDAAIDTAGDLVAVRLAAYAFTWVLPGHGRRFRAASASAMRAELLRLARTM